MKGNTYSKRRKAFRDSNSSTNYINHVLHLYKVVTEVQGDQRSRPNLERKISHLLPRGKAYKKMITLGWSF